MTHTIDISPEALKPIDLGIKTFILLKDDRNYVAGDTIVFQILSERIERAMEVTCLEVETTGLKNGYILLGIKPKEL
jgi:uncharacterized protein DUF3850